MVWFGDFIKAAIEGFQKHHLIPQEHAKHDVFRAMAAAGKAFGMNLKSNRVDLPGSAYLANAVRQMFNRTPVHEIPDTHGDSDANPSVQVIR